MLLAFSGSEEEADRFWPARVLESLASLAMALSTATELMMGSVAFSSADTFIAGAFGVSMGLGQRVLP